MLHFNSTQSIYSHPYIIINHLNNLYKAHLDQFLRIQIKIRNFTIYIAPQP